jgi:hypothetical protein
LFVDEPRQSPLSDAEKLNLVCNYIPKEIRDGYDQVKTQAKRRG